MPKKTAEQYMAMTEALINIDTEAVARALKTAKQYGMRWTGDKPVEIADPKIRLAQAKRDYEMASGAFQINRAKTFYQTIKRTLDKVDASDGAKDLWRYNFSWRDIMEHPEEFNGFYATLTGFDTKGLQGPGGTALGEQMARELTQDMIDYLKLHKRKYHGVVDEEATAMTGNLTYKVKPVRLTVADVDLRGELRKYASGETVVGYRRELKKTKDSKRMTNTQMVKMILPKD